jgi:hypothetical protein
VDILELIARSEWPIVVGGAVFLFRRPLVALMSRINLTKIDAWGLTAEFEKGLEKVEKLTPPSMEELKQISMDEKGQGENVTQSFKISSWTSHIPEPCPEAVVLGAWTSLEVNMRAMIDFIHPGYVIGKISLLHSRLVQAGREFGLDEDEIKSLKTLRNLRNSVAHSTEQILTWDDAMRFKAIY